MTPEEIRELIRKEFANAVPIGSIHCFATASPPEEFIPCDGRELNIGEYRELYDIIGNTFGGIRNTFRVPDLQGQFIRGWDKEGNEDPERAFGSPQKDGFQGHTHEFNLNAVSCESDGGHSHSLYEVKTWRRCLSSYSSNNCSQKVFVAFGDRGTNYNTRNGTTTDGAHTHSLSVNEGASPVGIPVHSRWRAVEPQVETRPKNIALLYCIKAK